MTTPEIPPVRVEVVNQPKPAIPSTRYRRRSATTTTILLSAVNPVQKLLPMSPRRCSARVIQYGDADFVICHSESMANKVSALADFTEQVDGTLVPRSYPTPIELDTTSDLWVATCGNAINAAITEITPGNPAPGALFTYTNNTGAPQLLTSARFTLVTDAAVANRFPSVQILDSQGNIVAFNGNLTGIPASTTQSVFLAVGLANIPNAAGGSVIGGLPSIILQPGWQVKINVTGLDVGDQISAIVLGFGQSPSGIAPAGIVRVGVIDNIYAED